MSSRCYSYEIIDKLKIIFSIPKQISNLARARILCSQERYEDALKLLDDYALVASGRDAEFHLLRGHIFLRVGKDLEAYEESKLVRDILSTKERYKGDEAKYLNEYSLIMSAKSLSNLGRDEECKGLLHKSDIPSIALGNVSKSIKRRFPLDAHPKWKAE